MATADHLHKVATDIVLQKALEDKLKLVAKGRKDKEESTADLLQKKEGETEDDSINKKEHLDDLTHWREQRYQQLKEAQQRKVEQEKLGHGKYEEIEESEFLPAVTQSPLAAVHFYSPSFEKCKIMDQRLSEIAPKHPETRFLKLNAEKALFFTQKLRIFCLPSVALFKGGIAVHTLVGFAELGNGASFSSQKLEGVLAKYKVLHLLDRIMSSDSSDDDEEK